MIQINPKKIKEMQYVELMAFLEEINRPPGGKDSIRRIVQNCFIRKDSKVLDVGCNTGYCSFEIAHLSKCLISGIDISSVMIKTAKKFQQYDPLGHLIKFRKADAMNLPFKDEVFDVVISGGSTAFIKNKEKAIKEYKRVLKPWGFVADINFFYNRKPPANLIHNLNSLMDTEIKPWQINYWLDLYKKCNLEQYFIFKNNVKQVNIREVTKYCTELTRYKNFTKETKKELLKRLIDIMVLFNQNHKYLAYGIFIFRKRPAKEQVSLFGV